jgi:hypothetical protein
MKKHAGQDRHGLGDHGEYLILALPPQRHSQISGLRAVDALEGVLGTNKQMESGAITGAQMEEGAATARDMTRITTYARSWH